MEKIKTLSILGPTASGKSALAVEMAKRLGGQVISCDSMQLYRDMDIGTASVTEEEKQGVVHHLISIKDPEEEFSAAEYAGLARAAIGEIAGQGMLPVICGGTGLYHDSIMKISGFEQYASDEDLRRELYGYAAEHGREALHAMLAEIDPAAAESIHPNNVKRVVRAIEIYRLTGTTKTELDVLQTSGETPYDDTMVILEYSDRALLYSRTDRRVDLMMEQGLEKEVRNLFGKHPDISRTAMQAIGYKEFIPYFKGEIPIETVAENIKLATRHYVKRQLIWFRRYGDAVRIHPDRDGDVRPVEEIADELMSVMESRQSAHI